MQQEKSLRNGEAQRTFLFALCYRYWPPLVACIPTECTRGTMASSKMRGRKLSVIKISPSVHLLSAFLFSARIDRNAGGREWGKVIALKPIKVVSVPEIAGGYCQGMCLDVLFSLTFLVNLRETPNRAVWNHTKASPVVPFVHCVARICSVLAKSSTDPFNLRSDGHMLIFGSLTSTATNRASEDEARSNCTEKCVKMCTEKNAAKFANQCCSFLKYLTNWDLSQKTISMHKMTMKINSF